MSKQNEMMAQALKEYMQMRADDIAEVCEIMSIEDVKTKNARQDKYIEDTLNDVFSRHMPDLQPGEELGMGFGKERILNEVIREADANGTFDVVFDGDELGKANPEVQKRLTEIMLTRKEIWMDDELGKLHPRTQEYIKWMFEHGVGIMVPNDSPEMKRTCIEAALRFEQSTGKTYAPSEPWIDILNGAKEAQYGSIAERKRKFKLNKPKGETK